MSKNINQDKVDPKLLEILVCPVTKSDLQYDSKNNELLSKLKIKRTSTLINKHDYTK